MIKPMNIRDEMKKIKIAGFIAVIALIIASVLWSRIKDIHDDQEFNHELFYMLTPLADKAEGITSFSSANDCQYVAVRYKSECFTGAEMTKRYAKNK